MNAIKNVVRVGILETVAYCAVSETDKAISKRSDMLGGSDRAKVNVTLTPASVKNAVGFVLHTVIKEIIIALIMTKFYNLLHRVCLS